MAFSCFESSNDVQGNSTPRMTFSPPVSGEPKYGESGQLDISFVGAGPPSSFLAFDKSALGRSAMRASSASTPPRLQQEQPRDREFSNKENQNYVNRYADLRLFQPWSVVAKRVIHEGDRFLTGHSQIPRKC